MRLWKGCFEMDEKQAAIDALILFRQLWCVEREATKMTNELCFRCSDCPMEDENGYCAAKLLAIKHGTKDQKHRANVVW